MNELIEKLAALEHEQWMSWTQLVVGAERDNEISLHLHKKWSPNWKPYSELPENLKEYDRIWARRVVKLIQDISIKEISHAK